MSAATTDLHAEGTTLATLIGIIATDLERLKSLAPSTADPSRLEPWLAALGAAVNSGVTAVRASSAGNIPGFQAAAAEMQSLRTDARALALSLGYGSCRY